MADPDRPLLADATEEVAQLGSDLVEIAELRWRLARLELEAAAGSIKRLTILLAVAAVMALTALSVLLVGLIHLLPETWRAGALVTLGLVLLLGAIVLAWWARRRFRRKFVGLEETLEEFREDLVWFQEWTGGTPTKEE